MALELSIRCEQLSRQTEKRPQLILEVEGYGTFGALTVTKIAKFGDAGLFFGNPGLVFGGVTEDTDALSLIDLGKSSGGASPITQQLLQDKGGSGSVSTVTIEIVDKNEIVTQAISPGFDIEEFLSQKARVYINFEGGAHPEDSVQIFNGTVQDIRAGAGRIKLTIGAPESLKRQDLFVKGTTSLDGALNNSDTTITVVSTSDFLNESLDATTLRTYIRIDDEIIKYTGTTDTTFTGCTRGAFGTAATNHDDETSVESIYRLTGTLSDLALKIMLSNGDDQFRTDVPVIGIVDLPDASSIPNSIAFSYDVEAKHGLVLGDFISLEGTSGGSNDFSNRAILSITSADFGSYIVVGGGSLVSEPVTSGLASFKSKYDLLPEGLGMSPEQVDVARHEELQGQFGASFFEYDFRLPDSEKGTEFINTQIYWPSGCYQLFRGGRASLGITLPPIAQLETQTINSENVFKPAEIEISRSVNKNFYNTVVYKFEEYVLDGRFLQGQIFESEASINRVKNVGSRVLTIEARGVRKSADNINKIRIQARRFLDRYQYGAEVVPVQVNFGEGFPIEVGDTVIFGDEDLKISDIKTGNRQFQPRLMEVTNKSMRITTGEIKLELTDTAFELDGRYGVISPSSILGAGSTGTELVLQNSYGNQAGLKTEDFKWRPYIGQPIVIRSVGYGTVQTSVIRGFDPFDPNIMIIDDLGAPPLGGQGSIVEIATYPGQGDANEIDATYASVYKAVHVFWDKQCLVASGASNFQFDTSSGAGSFFKVGDVVFVHTPDYSTQADETTVTDVTGDTITVADDLGFTPDNTFVVDLLGFPDGGLPYRWL